MRKTIALGITAATTAGLAAFVPATANAASGTTPVTFTLSGGFLTLTVPSATATLAGGALSVTGSSVTGQLGTTTVSDARGLLTATDTVTMSTTDFSDGAGNIVPATGNATGYSGVATPTGTGLPVPTLTGQNIAGTGSTILTIAVIGSGGASYNPTVSVTIPAGAVQGTYTGTVTQSVS
jgi:hypothetical protein